MKMSPRYRMPFKRRLDQKTNYSRRLKLLLSKKPRLVVRRSNKYVRGQIIKFNLKGDQTIISASSNDLEKFGWTGNKSNIPCSYLVGLMIGKKALEKNIKSVVLDVGVQRNVKKSRIYAFLKGAVNAGLDVPHSEKMFPPEDRIKGVHIDEYNKSGEKVKLFEKIKSKIIEGKSNGKQSKK